MGKFSLLLEHNHHVKAVTKIVKKTVEWMTLVFYCYTSKSFFSFTQSLWCCICFHAYPFLLSIWWCNGLLWWHHILMFCLIGYAYIIYRNSYSRESASTCPKHKIRYMRSVNATVFGTLKIMVSSRNYLVERS